MIRDGERQVHGSNSALSRCGCVKNGRLDECHRTLVELAVMSQNSSERLLGIHGTRFKIGQRPLMEVSYVIVYTEA